MFYYVMTIYCNNISSVKIEDKKTFVPAAIANSGERVELVVSADEVSLFFPLC